MGEGSEQSRQKTLPSQSTPQVSAEVLVALTAVGIAGASWAIIGVAVTTNAKANSMTAQAYIRSHYIPQQQRWVRFESVVRYGAKVTSGKLIDDKLGTVAEFTIIDRTEIEKNANAIYINISMPDDTARFDRSHVMYADRVEIESGDESWEDFFHNQYILLDSRVAHFNAIVIWPLDLYQWLRDCGQEAQWRAWCAKYERRVS